MRVIEECLQPSGDNVRCIDDRIPRSIKHEFVSAGNPDGPQFLGGSLGVLALAAEFLAGQNPDTELVFETVYSLTLNLHEKASLKLGVHMDDHHGKLRSEEIINTLESVKKGNLGDKSLIPGCGFAGLLTAENNPLNLSAKVSEFFRNYPNVVDELVRRKASLSVLTGNHAIKGKVLAVENPNEGVTVNTKLAIKLGMPAYSHDTGTFRKLIEPIGKKASEIMVIYRKWLLITTNILAGMDTVQLPVLKKSFFGGLSENN